MAVACWERLVLCMIGKEGRETRRRHGDTHPSIITYSRTLAVAVAVAAAPAWLGQGRFFRMRGDEPDGAGGGGA